MLSVSQSKFLVTLFYDYPFKLGESNKGYTVEGVTNLGAALYLTLTMRSLLRKGLIEVRDRETLKVTSKGIDTIIKEKLLEKCY